MPLTPISPSFLLDRTPIWIEEASCVVPYPGEQQERRRLRDELRKSNPAHAAMLERFPGYVDPDSEYASDEWAYFGWTWMGDDQIMWESCSFLHVSLLPTVQKYFAISKPIPREGRPGGYSFYVKASYALAVLEQLGKIPPGSVLMNKDEKPSSWAAEENKYLKRRALKFAQRSQPLRQNR